MRLIVILLILVVYGWWHFSGTDWTQYAPGATVAAPPVQTATNRPAWVYKDYSITPLAHFAMDARVIAIRSYSNQDAALAPYDVVMGWQTMSDPPF